MSKYTVQLEDLRLKLAHRNNELGEMKSKVCKLELTLSVNHLHRIFVSSVNEGTAGSGEEQDISSHRI